MCRWSPMAAAMSAALYCCGAMVEAANLGRPNEITERRTAMAELVHQHEVLTQDFAEIEAVDFGLADVQFVDQHLIDPRGRTVRVRSFYRLYPGEVHERNKRRGGNDEKRPETDLTRRSTQEARHGRHSHC